MCGAKKNTYRLRSYSIDYKFLTVTTFTTPSPRNSRCIDLNEEIIRIWKMKTPCIIPLALPTIDIVTNYTEV